VRSFSEKSFSALCRKVVMAAGTVCSEHNKLITDRAVDCWERMRERYGVSNMWDTCLCLGEERYNSSFYIKTLEHQMREQKVAQIELERAELKVADRVQRDKVKEVEDSRWYLITFTNKPTEMDPSDLLKRTMKVVKSKQVAPLQWSFALEIQPNTGAPHTHIVLESNKYFDYNKIKNFNGGRVADVQKERWDIKKYPVKDETKPSKEWLSNYGLTQWFWCSDDYAGPRPGEISESSSNIISWT